MNLDEINNQLELTTERLSLRLMKETDWPFFKQLQTNPTLMKYIGPVLDEKELKSKFNHRITTWDGQEDHWLTFIVQFINSNEPVGSIGFRFNNIFCQRVEIGYLMSNEYQGQGITQEVAESLISYLFNIVQVKKIVAHCSADNIASWKVMEKLGMKREGYFKQHNKIDGKWSDDLAYGLINPD